MSGIAGIWNVDGQPVARETIAAMSHRLSHRGPDGESLLVNGAVGFACQLLRVTPESRLESQPVVDQRGCVLVWDGRLDNRAQLLRDLCDHPNVSATMSDPELVLAGHAAFAAELWPRLEGDFALGLWDPACRTLSLVRDVMGSRSLDYCRFGNHFLFASETKALLAHPSVSTEPDDLRLAEWLYQVFDYSNEASTFFKDIYTVPAGCVVTVTPERTSLRRYWEFDPSARLRLGSYDEYVEAYKEAFVRAVRNRLRSAFPVGIAVSGGLDSSSIFCTAKEEIRRTPAGLPDVFGIALVADHPTTDESVYREAIEEKYGIQLITIPFDTTNPPGDIETDTWYGEGPYIKSLAWRNYYRVAMQHGARVVISGFFGDHLLLNPQYLLDLAKPGMLGHLYRHLKSFYSWWDGYPAAASTMELWLYVRGYLISDSVRPLYHKVRRMLRKQNIIHMPWYSARFGAVAEQLDAEKTLLRLGRGDVHAKVLFHNARSRLHSLRLNLDRKIDTRFPCEQSHPFRDRELVRLVMSIPGEIMYQSGSRGIHRDAMKGILPEAVRTRNTKTSYGHPFKLGALHDLTQYGAALEAGTASRMGYLAGKQELADSLTTLRQRLEMGNNARNTWCVLDLLGLEAWLSVFFGAETGSGFKISEGQ